MSEHPFVTAAKVGLLTVIAVLLVLHFTAINETQSKVIETADRVDQLQDHVVDLRRSVKDMRVVRGGTGGVQDAPATAADARAAELLGQGWTSMLGDEPDPPRLPDSEIDFDAQFNTSLPVEPKGFNIYTSDRDAYTADTIGFYVLPPLAERKNADKDSFKPAVAERAFRSPDRRTFLIFLRPGIRWHRPAVDLTNPRYAWMRGDHELTAEDYVFTLDRIFDVRADTDNVRPNYADIESYEAVDSHTLRVTFRKADFYSTAVALNDLRALPKWIYTRDEDGAPVDEASLGPAFAQHWFNKNMCGYGPYRFKEYKTSDYVLVERDEDFWGRRPGFKRILYKLNVRDDQLRFNTFMHIDEATGRRDQDMYAIAPSRYKREVLDDDGSGLLRQQFAAGKFYIFAYQRMMFAYTGWANRGKFFDDRRVRRAMTLCANRALWRKDILYDIAVFPTGVCYVESPEYDATVEPWPFDPAQAARLLDEAGWKDTDDNGVRDKVIGGATVEFRFKLLQTPNSPDLESMRSDWAQELQRIGVVMETDVVEWSQFLKRTRDREFDAFSGAWRFGDEFKPDTTYHSRLIDEPGSYNYLEWSNARADEIMDALHTTFDLKERYRLCHEFHAIFHEEQPCTTGWSWRNPVLCDSRIGGVFARNFGPQVDFRYLFWVKDGVARYDDGRDRLPEGAREG